MSLAQKLASLLNSSGLIDSTKLAQKSTLGTLVASTSGASIEFTGIPSWVKRITLTLSAVSTTGSNIPIVQLGTSGGFETSGYAGAAGGNAASAGAGGVGPASGHGLALAGGATFVYTGKIEITRMSSTQWVITSAATYAAENAMAYAATRKTLSGQLDRVRLTSVGSTDTFDAGSVNIIYE